MTIRKKTGIGVSGQKCAKGKDYAIQELLNPTRVLTATIKIKEGVLPLLPVRTNLPILKDKIFECIRNLSRLEVKAPTKMGETILKNIADTGSDLISTRDMERVQCKQIM